MKIAEILLPTDFSAAAEAAALVATAMALETGARLHVVHVVPVATDPSLGSEQLTRVGRQIGKEVTAETALLSGRAVREIAGYAPDKGIDLIVMSTHGRTGMSRALLGSVAEAVVRLSPCLVLTVPMTPVGTAAHASGAAQVGAPTLPHHCIVCAGATEDLVCESCRARIRGGAHERKIETERPGRIAGITSATCERPWPGCLRDHTHIRGRRRWTGTSIREARYCSSWCSCCW